MRRNSSSKTFKEQFIDTGENRKTGGPSGLEGGENIPEIKKKNAAIG